MFLNIDVVIVCFQVVEPQSLWRSLRSRQVGDKLAKYLRVDVLGLSAQGLRTSAFEETFASPRPPPDCIARLGADGCAFMPPSAPTDLFRQVPLTGPLIKTRFLQCPESPCEVVQEGTITMRDDVHLTAAFAASLWEPIGREVARRMTL